MSDESLDIKYWQNRIYTIIWFREILIFRNRVVIESFLFATAVLRKKNTVSQEHVNYLFNTADHTRCTVF